MTLGEKLKEARKQAGLSQEQLSEKLGVSRSAAAKWETDNGIPVLFGISSPVQKFIVLATLRRRCLLGGPWQF